MSRIDDIIQQAVRDELIHRESLREITFAERYNTYFTEWLLKRYTPEQLSTENIDKYYTYKNFVQFFAEREGDKNKRDKQRQKEIRKAQRRAGLPVDSTFKNYLKTHYQFWIGLLLPLIVSIIALFQSTKDLRKEPEFIQLQDKVSRMDSLLSVQDAATKKSVPK